MKTPLLFHASVSCALLAFTSVGSASIILNNYGDGSPSNSGVRPTLLSRINVGGSNVAIGGFGQVADPTADGQARAVIFQGNLPSAGASPVFDSGPFAVTDTGSGFYDSYDLDYTLLAGQTYWLGLAFEDNAIFGFENSGTNTAGGLTSPAWNSTNAYGVSSGTFEATTWGGPGQFAQASIRIYTPDSLPAAPAAIPEPGEAVVVLCGFSGLLLGGRRRKR